MSLSLSIPQALEATGLGRTYLYQLINQGKIPAKKLGRRTVILKSDLEAFLNSLPAYEPRSAEGQTNE